MINAKITDIPVPVTRTEHFMYSAITGNESGLKADTQAEMYLEAIKDGDVSDLEGLEPRTVLDMYLEARQTGNLDDLPKPRTTSEMLLYQAITGEDLGAKPVSNMDKYLSLLEPNNYDARLEIESEESVIHLTDSKNGVVEVKELEGNTLVNIVPKPSKVVGDGNINDRVIISDNVVELTLESGFYTGINFTQNSGLIKPNTTYTLIANIIENTMTQGGFAIMEANDNTIFNGVNLPLGYKGIYVATTTTRSSGTLFRIQSMSNTVCKTGEKIKFSLMILEGDWTNKEIPVEHFEGMKSVGECEDNKIEIVSANSDSTLSNKKEITLSESLRGLPNGVRDRIVLKDGRLMIERNTGQILLNGDNNEKWVFESDWTSNSGELSRFLIAIPNQKHILWHELMRESKNYSINNRFNALENIAETFTLEVEHFTGWDFGKFVLNIKTSRLSIKNELGLKQWLSENPIELVYELETPTYEEITPELQRLVLRCYDDATLFFNTIIPPKSLISYTANTSNIYKYLDTLKLSKAERDSIINSMERV